MKMKLLVLWVWFLVMFLATSADTSFSVDGGRKASTETRKLKEESYEKGTSHELGKVSLDDYHPPDPPPSSGVITSGPIEYGTPFMPHIPKPKPGDDSNNATSPPSPSPVQSPPATSPPSPSPIQSSQENR